MTVQAVGYLGYIERVAPPREEDGGINHTAHNNVYYDTSHHNDQSLPCWFGTKLPALCGFVELVFVHAFVHHSRDFDITSKGQPANTVGGFSYFFLHQREIGIEEKIEFLYSGFEEFGRDKVPQLMKDNEE